jgi:hypothetical protein
MAKSSHSTSGSPCQPRHEHLAFVEGQAGLGGASDERLAGEAPDRLASHVATPSSIVVRNGWSLCGYSKKYTSVGRRLPRWSLLFEPSTSKRWSQP